MNLIMYYWNIYVNNHKFLLIIGNVQLYPGLIDSHENLLRVEGF